MSYIRKQTMHGAKAPAASPTKASQLLRSVFPVIAAAAVLPAFAANVASLNIGDYVSTDGSGSQVLTDDITVTSTLTPYSGTTAGFVLDGGGHTVDFGTSQAERNFWIYYYPSSDDAISVIQNFGDASATDGDGSRGTGGFTNLRASDQGIDNLIWIKEGRAKFDNTVFQNFTDYNQPLITLSYDNARTEHNPDTTLYFVNSVAKHLTGNGVAADSFIDIQYGKLIIDNSVFEDIHESNYGGSVLLASAGASEITISNSEFNNNSSLKRGGSILILNDDPGQIGQNKDLVMTVEKTKFSGNSSANGGAVFIQRRGAITFSSSEFSDNYAPYGGAIYFNEVKGGSNSVQNSVFTGNGIKQNTDSDPSYTVYGGAIYAVARDNTETEITGSEFNGNAASYGGAAYIYQYGAGHTDITASSFNGNQASSGGAVYLNEKTDGSSAVISDSAFEANEANSGGAVFVAYKAPGTVLIDGSSFTNNTAYDQGGAVEVWAYADGASATFRNSTFSGNVSYNEGGALYGGSSDGNTAVFNIIADGKDTVFSGNKIILTDSEGTATGETPNDIQGKYLTLNINAAEGSKVAFASGIDLSNPDADGNEQLSTVNINAEGVTYSTGEAESTDETTGAKTYKTAEAPTGGTAEFTAYVNNADLHVFNGTLALLPTDATAMSDGIHQDIDYLAKSNLTIEGGTQLKTRSAAALSAMNYAAADEETAEADAASLAENIVLQRVTLGRSLTLNSTLFIQPAVDLSVATEANGAAGNSDQYVLSDSAGTVQGSGKLTVNGWIIKADTDALDTVYVDLTDADSPLRASFDLDEKGTRAIGAIRIWKVTHPDPDSSVYVFSYPAEEPSFFVDPGEEEPENQEEPAAPAAEPETPAAPVDTPFNYNPDIYAGQVAALSTGIIQHAIADSVFAEAGLAGNFLATDEKPERKPWWGKVRGADLNLKTKNFYGIDYDYALAMIGHQFEPIKTASGDVEFGAYLGAATANAKYASNKVRQNGGFIGGSVLYRNGHAFAGAHANFGIMNNRAKGYSDNSFTTPWIGLGATAGYTFEMPAIRTAVTPLVDFSCVNIQSKDYTTGQGARVKNSSLNSFEVAPGVRVDKRFAKGWSAFGLARYAFVSKSSGSTTASVGTNSTVLPAIANKNYAEYGLGIQKEAKSYGVSFNVTRSDGGRSGWTGMIRAHMSF